MLYQTINIVCEMNSFRLVPDLSSFFKKLYVRSQEGVKTNGITFKTVDPEICSILSFCENVWDKLAHHVLCMSFQEKCFSCYILLTDQI